MNFGVLPATKFSTLSISLVARESRLNGTRLCEKAIQAGIVLSTRGKPETARPKKAAFQEISLDRIFAVVNFPKNKIRYYALSGPNSNSVARYLGQILGYDGKEGPPHALGWSARIPNGVEEP